MRGDGGGGIVIRIVEIIIGEFLSLPPPRLILKKNKATYIFASEQVLLRHVLQQCNLPGWIHKQGIYVCVSAWIHRGTL